MNTKAEKKNANKRRETLSESISGVVAVLVTGIFVITFVFQAFSIPSRSMERTLLVGDHVFVDRLTPTAKAGYVGPFMPYRELHRGDVIVFLSPVVPGLHVVKRIIGVPGDRIHLRDAVVYRNGERLEEPYVIRSQGDYSPYRDNFPAVSPVHDFLVSPEWPIVMRQHIEGDDLVVPPDYYFGMGDNRDLSLDSRYWGFIPRQNIIGRPLLIYWSFVTPEDQYQRTAWSDRFAFLLHIVSHFAGQTRWSRMFHVVR